MYVPLILQELRNRREFTLYYHFYWCLLSHVSVCSLRGTMPTHRFNGIFYVLAIYIFLVISVVLDTKAAGELLFNPTL